MSWFGNVAGHKLIAASFLLGSWLLASPALATVFLFNQTSASEPGIFVSAAISINGDFSDLPTVNSNDNPIFLGNLRAFDIVLPIPDMRGGHYTLSDFMLPCSLDSPSCFAGFPIWTISPGGVTFISALDETNSSIDGFGINSTISFISDAGASPPIVCG